MHHGQLYVYGVARPATDSPLPAAGVDGQRVEQVEHGRFSAIVSAAPGTPVKASRRNLMAHTSVLQEIAAARCVLPMRFGVVMPGEAAVREELLDAHAQALDAQLEAFAELVELDLKIVCPEEVLLRAIINDRPDLAELRDRVRKLPEDAAYFDRIRLGELVAGAVEETRHSLLQRVVGELEPLAVGTEVGEPAHEQMLVNVAFLVDRARVERFDEIAAKLAEELGPDLRFKYVGPLPPFHFVDTAADPGNVAWA